ncbi:MAG TPA: hypothetical protein VM305_09475 [Candidatus Limnocylindrales bacterium]|nr:hypothetical protein [Candidatus Limnocylindrales bacterium]
MPDIEYAFLADAADARPGHKFAVIGGGVSRLGGPQFPLRHPHLALVCGLLVTTPELGTEHELQFVLLTPDGKRLSNATAKIVAGGATDGRDTVLTFSLDMWNLAFPAPGDYSIRILVDGSERKRLPLVVEQRTAPPAGQQPGQEPPKPPFPPQTGQA